MRLLIVVAFLIGLCCEASPGFAESSRVKDAARRECFRQFGGDAELIRIDNKRGYIFCRSGKRQIDRIPFRMGNADNRKSDQDPPTKAPRPRKVAVDPPESGAGKCQGCAVKADKRKSGAVNADPGQAPTVKTTPPPAPEVAVTADPPVAVTVTPTAPVKQVTRKTYDSRVLEQARNICVKQYGQLATVDYIDESNWEVVCKKP